MKLLREVRVLLASTVVLTATLVLLPGAVAGASTAGFAYVCATFDSSSSQRVWQQIYIDDGNGNQLYAGTEHQCQGYEWWFEMTVSNGHETHVWSKAISGSHKHTFSLYENSSNHLIFQVDSTVESEFNLGSEYLGAYAWVGLRSTDDGNTASSYQESNLKYQTYELNTWNAFAGLAVPSDSNMCVAQVSGTVWDIGDNASC